MHAIWNEDTNRKGYGLKQKELTGEHFEIAVIGGGMAGLLTALLLQEKGKNVVVLEAQSVGSGQTQYTTAKITSQHGLIYQYLVEKFGMDKAMQYAKANEKAIAQYERIIQMYHIECHFESCTSYLYSRKDFDLLKREAEIAKKLGIKADYVTKMPFLKNVYRKMENKQDVKFGAVSFRNQAQFHPLKFLYAIASQLDVRENVKVKTVEEHKIITNCGECYADKIVFTTHYPFINVPGYFFMRMHQERSYVVAVDTKGISENLTNLDGIYYGIDKENGYSFRSYQMNSEIILLGGGNHRTGKGQDIKSYQQLIHAAETMWPNGSIVCKWSAQDCMTLDRVPYIGKYCESRPDWYVATGFQKWGMSHSMAAAMLLSERIVNKKYKEDDIFSPQRSTFVSIPSLMKEGVEATKALLNEKLSLPKEKIDELPVSSGAIVEYGGEKVGVYKKKEDEVYIVNTRCPHLGCQLEWNPEDLSWDCPCHGSRFNYMGKLIDNPAQEDLADE